MNVLLRHRIHGFARACDATTTYGNGRSTWHGVGKDIPDVYIKGLG